MKKIFQGLGISGAIVSAIIFIVISGIFEEATKAPDVVITKVRGPDFLLSTILVNETADYKIEVYNQGDKAATNCRISPGKFLASDFFQESFSLIPGQVKDLEYPVFFEEAGIQELKFKIMCDDNVASNDKELIVLVKQPGT